MSLGQLQKMTIVSYSDDSFEDAFRTNDSYEVLINPESYTLNYGVQVNETSAQGASEQVLSFNKRMPQSLSFKFIFDGTGIVKRGGGGLLSGVAVPGLPADKPDVVEDFTKFKKAVYSYDSDTHQPRFVQLQWGPLIYNCRLSSISVAFKLFRPDGTPVRAEADCTFQAVISKKKLKRLDNPHSPDLTKVRTVIEGDTLPLLCFKEYGDSKYYFEVARFNHLTDFKRLVPGTKLFFPPVAK